MKYSKMRDSKLNAEKVQKYLSNSYPSIFFFLILDNRLRSGFNTSKKRIDKVDHHCDGTDQQAVRKSGYKF